MKIFLLFMFLIPNLLFSQLNDYKIKVEIDDSSKYRYETEYYKAMSDYYDKENADRIKGFADKYFTALRRNADAISEQKLNSPEVEAEFNRLKYYGEEILNLLPLLNNNEVTGNKAVHTIEKAFEELNYSVGNPNGNLYKILKKNSKIRDLNLLSEEVLQNYIISRSNETQDSLKNLCSNQNRSYKACLISIIITVEN